jgi:alginate O-acetyltransferase complex protein AlgI
MLFNSYTFLFAFLPIAIVGYYLLGHRATVESAKLWLIGASFVFYGWWNAAFVLLLVISIAINYLFSLAILGEEKRPHRQSLLLAGGITLNLAALVYYKYLFPLIGFLHGVDWLSFDLGAVILPLGISFFTFTQIGYLVDCAEGLVEERKLSNYVLFVTFFPHLIAGPILHHREIMPQFADADTYRLNGRKLGAGFALFVLGLVKKVLLADTIAPYADTGFAHTGQLGFLGSWSTALAYSLQLYCDFSGYSDMAVGLGAMFGVSLPINFNSPYKSSGVIDFWQRWHMTLTRYLTLLLYNPISLWVTRRRMAKGLPANRRAAATVSGFIQLIGFPTFTTILLAGIWHGAGLQFIVFGLLHSTYLIINHAWRLFGPQKAVAAASAVRRVFDRIWPVGLTYLSVLLAQIFFRANSVGDAVNLLKGAFGLHGSDLPLAVRAGSFDKFGALAVPLQHLGLIAPGAPEVYDAVTKPLLYNSAIILGLLVLVWGTPNTYQILGSWNPALQKVKPARWPVLRWQPNLAWSLCTGVALFLVFTMLGHPGKFLYFQF